MTMHSDRARQMMLDCVASKLMGTSIDDLHEAHRRLSDLWMRNTSRGAVEDLVRAVANAIYVEAQLRDRELEAQLNMILGQEP